MRNNRQSFIAVWSRDLATADPSGRANVLGAVRSVLAAHGPLCELTSPTVFTSYGRFRGMLLFSFALVSSGLRMKPLPLQCALYARVGGLPSELSAAKDGIVLVESIRQLKLVEALRRMNPKLRIIVDMDDLMSRRVKLLIENGFTVSLGAFSDKMPGGFARLLASGRRLTNLLLRYEAKALASAETRLCAAADTIVTVSQLEATLLKNAVSSRARARVIAIAPPAHPPQTRITPFTSFEGAGPIRFVFVGSDTLIQNRSSIDALRALWETCRPNADLTIFGRQSRTYLDLPPRMFIRGPVSSIAEVYDGRSVLLCPTIMAGGVKTKVFEAFMHGAPVVGNSLTYEGIAPNESFLTLETPGLENMLTDPELVRQQLSDAARSGSRDVARLYGPEAFSAKWANVLSELEGR